MDIVLTEDHGAVRHVILNRPEKRNAMNEDLIGGIGAALSAAAADPSVHCVILRGEGKVFSSGMDLGSLAFLSSEPHRLREFRQGVLQAWNRAEEMTKPTICAVHGACIGGAMELALACDLRVMDEDALIGMPETRIGLIPDVGGSSRLPAIVGLGRAKDLVMTGRMIGAAEAERIGLVNRVAASGGVVETAEALAAELLECSPLAVGLAKRVMDASARPALAATLEQEVTAQELCARSEDFAEGTRAFIEKRAPVFTGR